MNTTHLTNTSTAEQAETAAAGDLAATLSKGPMLTNDDTTDDPGVGSNGEALTTRDPGDVPADSSHDE